MSQRVRTFADLDNCGAERADRVVVNAHKFEFLETLAQSEKMTLAQTVAHIIDSKMEQVA
jgi:predicted DNA-binding ribbon-helix-helix protein